MPSPFPGMDPYLEGSTWMNFHGQLLRGDRAAVGTEAAAALPRSLDASDSSRICSIDPDVSRDYLYPDVGVVEQDSPSTVAASALESPLLPSAWQR